jgi:hypothetical protein
MAREHDARWRRELLSLFARRYPRSLRNRGGRPGRRRDCVRPALSGWSAASYAAVVQARACLESSGPEELESTPAESPEGSTSLLFAPHLGTGSRTESRQGPSRSFRRTRPIYGSSLEARSLAGRLAVSLESDFYDLITHQVVTSQHLRWRLAVAICRYRPSSPIFNSFRAK